MQFLCIFSFFEIIAIISFGSLKFFFMKKIDAIHVHFAWVIEYDKLFPYLYLRSEFFHPFL